MSGKRFKLVPEMEGPLARWYARQRATESQIKAVRQHAARLTDGLASGARVLEIAPGPGYLAIEIARLGRCPEGRLGPGRRPKHAVVVSE